MVPWLQPTPTWTRGRTAARAQILKQCKSNEPPGMTTEGEAQRAKRSLYSFPRPRHPIVLCDLSRSAVLRTQSGGRDSWTIRPQTRPFNATLLNPSPIHSPKDCGATLRQLMRPPQGGGCAVPGRMQRILSDLVGQLGPRRTHDGSRVDLNLCTPSMDPGTWLNAQPTRCARVR